MNRVKLRSQDGSALVTALMVMLVILPLGLALLAIVDTQAKDSGSERTRDRAFNLADSALTSAAFSLGKYSWPSSGSAAPSNTGATGTASACSSASYGATLGATPAANSATAKLQPNLNASYEDSAYIGAAWQINVCDNDPADAAHPVWKDALLSRWNYDQNADGKLWIRSEATVSGRKRVLAGLVEVAQTPAMSSKYGVIAGRMNAELTNTVGTVLNGGLLGSLTSSLLGSHPLVAPDNPTYPSPTSGVTAVRCGALDGCLTGALGAAGSLSLVNSLVTSGAIAQATSPTAMSAASAEQLKQQAIASGTYVATTTGSSTTGTSAATVPPACTIPAAASSTTIVYIDKVGDGDQYCLLDVSATKAYKALVIGSGRVVLRGNNAITATSATATTNTFRGVVYALNLQRKTSLGDASSPPREVIRIDRGAHVFGGVAADGKSAQVGVYPPGLCVSLVVIDLFGAPIDTGCLLSGITSNLNGYNPAVQSNVALMKAVTVRDKASVVPGTYRDIAGEQKL
jgi:hypothetical protein